jgi:hypothetical protein
VIAGVIIGRRCRKTESLSNLYIAIKNLAYILDSMTSHCMSGRLLVDASGNTSGTGGDGWELGWCWVVKAWWRYYTLQHSRGDACNARQDDAHVVHRPLVVVRSRCSYASCIIRGDASLIFMYDAAPTGYTHSTHYLQSWGTNVRHNTFAVCTWWQPLDKLWMGSCPDNKNLGRTKVELNKDIIKPPV